MQSYIHHDFLLSTQTARELYHQHAAVQPIIDYHCHLLPSDLANNRQFDNLFDIWLAGDHYKWRAMRLNGEDERFCTGDATPYEKFLAYARTVPKTVRNPLHHWTHLELKRYFDIDILLDESTAPAIWEEANAKLSTKAFSAWGILEQRNVEMIGTTDDPTDDLSHHKALQSSNCPASVRPTFRPDKAFALQQSQSWNQWVNQLAETSGQVCDTLSDFLDALNQRIELFASLGCVASDHGIESCPEVIGSESKAAITFDRARSSLNVTEQEAEAFTGYLLCWLGERYAERGWVMQLHLGAIRNVNTAMFSQLGADIGCDSIHDKDQIRGVATLLGELSSRRQLPKTVLYNLDPAKNYAFATMCGNFFEAGVQGKVQLGSGWWFLDQMEGMTWQINALSSLGLLGNFIGMLTDSRSLMSYPRHEYFRRLLCRLLGEDIEDGQIPNDPEHIGQLVANISYHNAKAYFG